jgi:hypothetical protein
MLSFSKIKSWIYGIKADKLLHFIAGLIVLQVAYKLLMYCLPKYLTAIISFIIMVIIGGIKELVDIKFGVPSIKDFIATLIGGIIGLLIMLI